MKDLGAFAFALAIGGAVAVLALGAHALTMDHMRGVECLRTARGL